MTLAVLVHPAISITIGIASLIVLWWYWAVLSDSSVPVSRRRLRRLTTMLLLVAIPIMVGAMSFIDRATHPREFILAWMFVLILMMMIIVGAALDALNSIRLRSRELDREISSAAKDLKEAMDRQKHSDSEGKDDET